MSQRLARAAWRAPLPAAFYARDPVHVARDLLGCWLLHNDGTQLSGGRIVEVEAYLGPDDPASHAVAGRTPRTWHLFGAPGTCYVYRSYGVHWCANAVTLAEGSGSAVLLRAVQPRAGVEPMRARTPRAVPLHELARGPGRLCRALGIDRTLDGASLIDGALRIAPAHAVPPPPRSVPRPRPIVTTPRIGITRAADWPLRFLLGDEPSVSGARHWNRASDPSDQGEVRIW